MDMIVLTTEEKSNFKLAGVRVEAEIVDGTVRVLHLTDAEGRTYRLAPENFGSGIEISRPKPEMRYAVMLGARCLGSFCGHEDAQKCAAEFAKETGLSESQLTIEPVLEAPKEALPF